MTEVALITGGATGIGAEVARQLAADGVVVVICDINAKAGESLASEVDGRFIACDVTQLTGVESAVAKCIEHVGVPDYAHLNAGIMTVPTNEPFLAIEEVSEQQYRRIVGVNLDGVFHGLKTLLPVMREAGGGITITASTAGLTVVPVDPMYTATKYALVGLTRAVAAANDGGSLRINAICPGVTDTQIVPDDYKRPEFGMMPTSVMAAEIVELLKHAPNGEVRVKIHAEVPAFAIDPPDLAR